MTDDLIKKCSLFSGLSDYEYDYAIKYFGCIRKKYRRGEILHNAGEKLPFFALVLEGYVQVSVYDLEGNRMIMANVGPGETFGESLCFLKTESDAAICAVTDCEILKMSTSKLRKLSSGKNASLELMLSNRFTEMLARRTLTMNKRIQTLSKTSIRDKLLTYFTMFPHSGKKTVFEVPLNRNDLASYLGVNRSALSRELSAMKKEGIIDYHLNTFILK